MLRINPTNVVIKTPQGEKTLENDFVLAMTGYHPDCDLYRRAGIRLSRDTMNPAFNSETFETNVPGLFLAGGAICGKDTSNIFIENGRFHGEKIIGLIAERQGKRAAQ